MWIEIFLAQDWEDAEKALSLLKENKIIAKVRNIGGGYEILVPAPELEQAHKVLL